MACDLRNKTSTVLCIGAGPAGLTAAYVLSKHGVSVTVLERNPVNVGGISRTESHNGFRFDIGGHRFFSKSHEVEALWTELLGPDLLEVKRKSRIYYRGKLFDYPIRAFDALFKLGFLEAAACILSYGRARLRPVQPRNFEDWVVNHFGQRLFNMFFKAYTEKVWGLKCTEISADWAAQRIKGLSLSRALWHAINPIKKDKSHIKTLIDSFRYPRLGPGMMWEAASTKIRALGGAVHLGLDATRMTLDPATRRWTVVALDGDGRAHSFTASHIISTTSIPELVSALEPAPSPIMRKAAQSLRYRDFLVVALIIKDLNAFDDNWLYIHDPGVKVGRIQNIKSWSREMLPDQSLNSYCLEYFCFEGDNLWNLADEELITLACREIIQLRLVHRDDILDGYVIRQPKAYPIYDDTYQERVAIIRAQIKQHFPNLHLVGRNGMHKYNNQDHSMMTAILTARNILAGHDAYDVWRVNQDAEYHEADEPNDQSLNKLLTPTLTSSYPIVTSLKL